MIQGTSEQLTFQSCYEVHFLYKFYVYVHKFHQIFFLAVKGNN